MVGQIADDSLASIVRSYLDDDEVRLMPEDPDRELGANTWSYSLSGHPIDIEAVVTALDFVHRELGQRFADQLRTATFYAWYDAGAGQLRCSLASVPPNRLPFSGGYRLVTNAAEVVALAATDSRPGLLPWAALSEVGNPMTDGIGDGPRQPFPVWAASLH